MMDELESPNPKHDLCFENSTRISQSIYIPFLNGCLLSLWYKQKKYFQQDFNRYFLLPLQFDRQFLMLHFFHTFNELLIMLLS
jgi:hypothetical protein